MPALLNLPSQLYLSNTDPPFIYQCVGDQIKIVQVLGNTSLKTSEEIQNDKNEWDQIDASFEDTSPTIDTIENQKTEQCNYTPEVAIKDYSSSLATNTNVFKDETEEVGKNETNGGTIIEKIEEVVKNKTNNDTTIKKIEKDGNVESSLFVSNEVLKTEKDSVIANVQPIVDETDSSTPTTENVDKPKQSQNVSVTITEDIIESTSLDTSFNDVDSAESDDEASFGTPEDSPKSKRRSPKGRYGKSKAPPPPPVKSETLGTTIDNTELTDKIVTDAISTTSQESLIDIVNNLPNTSLKETATSKGLQVVNPIAEKKRRHKSKSPGRIPKGSSSGIGKLLQLPGKLAFWNKTDDKNKDNVSTSSGDISRKSSGTEKRIDEFQSCSELNDAPNEVEMKQKEVIVEQINQKESEDEKLQTEVADDQLSFKDASDFEPEVITHEIMEKSDALQRLIEAKLESHPEYKIVSLHEEILTSSKSTDV